MEVSALCSTGEGVASSCLLKPICKPTGHPLSNIGTQNHPDGIHHYNPPHPKSILTLLTLHMHKPCCSRVLCKFQACHSWYNSSSHSKIEETLHWLNVIARPTRIPNKLHFQAKHFTFQQRKEGSPTMTLLSTPAGQPCL